MGRGASPTQEQAMLIYQVYTLVGERAAKNLTEAMGFSVHVYYSVIQSQGKREKNPYHRSPKPGQMHRLRLPVTM